MQLGIGLLVPVQLVEVSGQLVGSGEIGHVDIAVIARRELIDVRGAETDAKVECIIRPGDV